MKLCILDGEIVDGTGAPAFPGDLVIEDQKIAAVAPRGQADCAGADLVLRVPGRTVIPGLIDLHAHADLTMPQYPAMENYLVQGITTLSVGHCTLGLAPIDTWYMAQCADDKALRRLGLASRNGYDPYGSIVVKTEEMRRAAGPALGFELDWTDYAGFLDHMRREGVGCNFRGYVSYGLIRLQAMGEDWRRPATAAEIAAMRDLLRRELAGGAYGMDCGFDYVPDAYAPPEEVAQVAQVLREFDAVLEAHTQNTQRRYGREWPDYRCSQGIRELLEIGKAADVRVHVSHIPNDFHAGKSGPGARAAAEQSARDILQMLEDYKAQGVRVTWDVIPPDCMSMLYYPQLASFFAPLVEEAGGMTPFAARLRTDGAFEAWILERIAQKDLDAVCSIFPPFRRCLSDPEGESTGAVRITRSACAEAQGRTVGELARRWGMTQAQTLLEVLKRDPAAYYYRVSKAATFGGEDVFLASPDAAVGLDSTASDLSGNNAPYGYPEDSCPPNNFNAMVKFLTETPLPFEQAVYKASGRSADILGLQDRGRLRAGNFADVAVLDRRVLAPVIDPARPGTGPRGVEYVLANGVFAVLQGRPTHSRSGQVLRRGREAD